MQKTGLKTSGVSLIEVVIVLGILMIMLTFSFANITFLNRALVHSEVDKLYSICMYLQRCAMVSNQKKVLTFDTINNMYHYNDYKERFPHYVRFGFLPGTKGPPSSPSLIVKSAVTFKNHSITFYPDGIIQSGTVYVTDIHKQFMYAISSPIAQVSYLRKYRYDGYWKCLS